MIWSSIFSMLLLVMVAPVVRLTVRGTKWLREDAEPFVAVCFAAIGGLSAALLVYLAVLCTPCQGLLISDGSRSGVVYRVSYKGVFWKTWEGTMSVGAMEETEKGFAPALFEFSVTSEEVVQQLREALRDGRSVEVVYQEYLVRGFPLGSTSYNITAVRPHEAR